MNERIYIYDRDGNLVNDPRRSVDLATNLRWSSMWPKGYGTCSFTVPRDIVATWAVKQAYEVIVRDGLKICYQGRLGDLKRQLSTNAEHIIVSAQGWYVELAERKLRKRWIDLAPVDRVEWAVDNDTQASFPFEKRENFLQIRMSAMDKENRTTSQQYRELYRLPAGNKVRRVTLDWKIRCGEGISIAIYNVDTSSAEWSTSTTTDTGSVNETFGTNANQIEFRAAPSANDDYDSNDYAWFDNIVIYCEMANFASPTYTGGEIVEDVLYLASTQISSDYTDIGDPGLVLSPFLTLNDGYETADSIIQRAAAYGDASLNTWGLCVWDETGASDGKPKAEFTYRDTSDYDWTVRLADLDSFDYQDDDSEIYNYIIVKYRDDKGITRYYTPSDNASQTDADSVSDYGRRDYVYDLGDGDTTRAAYVGDRFLRYHKDPLPRCSMALTGNIRDSHGRWMPCNRVRAGDRVRVVDWDGGTTYFLRSVSYNAENGQLTVNTDLPTETLPMLLAQQEIGS